ncbi:hypothetical protein D3C81_897160 [compost metagenome]
MIELDLGAHGFIMPAQVTGTVFDPDRNAAVVGNACALGDQRRGNDCQEQLVELAARHRCLAQQLFPPAQRRGFEHQPAGEELAHALVDQRLVEGDVVALVVVTNTRRDFGAALGQVQVFLELHLLVAQFVDERHRSELFGEWNATHQAALLSSAANLRLASSTAAAMSREALLDSAR